MLERHFRLDLTGEWVIAEWDYGARELTEAHFERLLKPYFDFCGFGKFEHNRANVVYNFPGL